MMDPEDLLTGCRPGRTDRKIGSHLNRRNSNRRFYKLKQTVVHRGIDAFVPQNRLHFIEAWVIAARPVSVGVSLIVERDRAVQRFFRRVAVTGSNYFVGIHQRDGTSREAPDPCLGVYR